MRKLVLFGVVVAGIVIGISGVQAANLPAEVTVSDLDCRDGEIASLELSVEYSGEDPVEVTPHVWSTRSHIQLSWDPTKITLEPGVNTVEIEPPRPRGRVVGDYAQVYLADGQRRAIANWRVKTCPS